MLAALRTATRAAHVAIETVPCLARLLAPDLTAPEYLWTLRRLHAFHAALEPDLALQLRGGSRIAVLVDGSALRAIEGDLAWFGSTPLAERPSVPHPESFAAALGALYVLEGSNLGGRLIGRHVANSLGVSVGAGGSFHCGLETGVARRRWTLFRQVLQDEIDARAVDPEPATSTALQAFAALERWLRVAGEPPAPPANGSGRGCPFAARAAGMIDS